MREPVTLTASELITAGIRRVGGGPIEVPGHPGRWFVEAVNLVENTVRLSPAAEVSVNTVKLGALRREVDA